MANLTFTPRLSRPESGNPYYNTRGNGGYSDAIKGKPTDPGCDVLANCVGYACGRFNEIGGWASICPPRTPRTLSSMPAVWRSA